MEHMVTIAIPERDEDLTMPIFDALVRDSRELGAVMGYALTGGPTDYVVGLDAIDAYEAAMEAVDIFRAVVAGVPEAAEADVTIVGLHAERVPDWELEESSELQTA
jgi:hypothetical protein